MSFKCPKCGASFEGQPDKCPNCGQLFMWPKEEVAITPIKEEPQKESIKNKENVGNHLTDFAGEDIKTKKQLDEACEYKKYCETYAQRRKKSFINNIVALSIAAVLLLVTIILFVYVKDAAKNSSSSTDEAIKLFTDFISIYISLFVGLIALIVLFSILLGLASKKNKEFSQKQKDVLNSLLNGVAEEKRAEEKVNLNSVMSCSQKIINNSLEYYQYKMNWISALIRIPVSCIFVFLVFAIIYVIFTVSKFDTSSLGITYAALIPVFFSLLGLLSFICLIRFIVNLSKANNRKRLIPSLQREYEDSVDAYVAKRYGHQVHVSNF